MLGRTSLSNFASLSKKSQIIRTQNTKQNPILTIKLNKEEEEEQADLTQSSGGIEDEWQWGGG